MIIMTITLIIISYIRHSTSKRIIAIVLKRMVMMIAIAMKMASSTNKKRITNRQTDKSGEAGRSRVSASLWAIQSRAPGNSIVLRGLPAWRVAEVVRGTVAGSRTTWFPATSLET